MMLEDNMEVPIGSVKETLMEAIDNRERPEDTALLAAIFSHIAEVQVRLTVPLRSRHPVTIVVPFALVGRRQGLFSLSHSTKAS